MTCKLCELPVSALGLCKKHYRQDLRARHRNQQPIRPYSQTPYYQELVEFIKKELNK